MTKFVLSIDGGGVRGVIPATILAEIERRSGQPICKLFDLIVGTSTGAIIAAGLCLTDGNNSPVYTANDILKFYQDHSRTIFKPSLFRTYYSWFRNSKFLHKPLEEVLDSYFKDTLMNDVCCNLMLCCFDIANFEAMFFKSWNRKTQSVKIKDALRASTAAPPYFMPKSMVVAQKERLLVDGGVLAANPASCAYASAVRLYPNEEIVLLSLGTGEMSAEAHRQLNSTNPAKYGVIGWILPPSSMLFQLVFMAPIRTVNYITKGILKDNFLRMETTLKYGSPEMDNSDPQNLDKLQSDALVTMENSKEVLDKFFKLRNIK